MCVKLFALECSNHSYLLENVHSSKFEFMSHNCSGNVLLGVTISVCLKAVVLIKTPAFFSQELTDGWRCCILLLWLLLLFDSLLGLLLGFLWTFPFHATILKPNFHLSFRQHQTAGHFKSFGAGQVFVLFKLFFQFQQLLWSERRARSSRFAQNSVVWIGRQFRYAMMQHSGTGQKFKLQVRRHKMLAHGNLQKKTNFGIYLCVANVNFTTTMCFIAWGC